MRFLVLLFVLIPAMALADGQIKWSVRTPDGHTTIVDYNMTDETMARFVEYVWNQYPQTEMDPVTGEDTGVPLERTPENEIGALIDWGLDGYEGVRTDVYMSEVEATGIEPMPPTFAPPPE